MSAFNLVQLSALCGMMALWVYAHFFHKKLILSLQCKEDQLQTVVQVLYNKMAQMERRLKQADPKFNPPLPELPRCYMKNCTRFASEGQGGMCYRHGRKMDIDIQRGCRRATRRAFPNLPFSVKQHPPLPELEILL